jgi:long-chain acyl-CoA synthetase
MLDPKKPPTTLAEMAQRSFVKNATRPYLGEKAKGASEYSYATYSEIGARVQSIAGGILSLDLARGDRAAILSESCKEWVISDLACQMVGVATVPFYATLPSNQIAVLLRDCGAELIFVSGAAQLQKILEIQNDLPELKHIVAFEAVEENAEKTIAFSDLENLGQKYWEENRGGYETLWIAALPDDVATIIYTSGTTGEPKGVMLSHRNILANVEQIVTSIELSENDSFLSFLPLAHVYERTAGYYLPTRLGAKISYCESLFTVDKNMKEVAPTIMFSVPRLYDSIKEKLVAAANSLPENQQDKYRDALALAQKVGAHKGHLPRAATPSLVENVKYKLYDAMVYSKIRDKFGGKLRFFVAGGAPLPPQIGALFLGMNVVILEGYGLTETAPVIAVNRPGEVRLGTVGKVLENLEVKIENDGEICVRGASIMKGYWNKPEATREVLTDDGWFHTGDVGVLQGDILQITDRKKDLLVLANGKKVAPAPIELQILQSEYVSQIVLVGDKLKAVAALIVPNFEHLEKWAQQNSVDSNDHQKLLSDQATLKLFKTEIEKYATGLADFERIKKIALLPEPFTAEAGEMTPTLKIKRRVVAEKYGHLVGGE